MIVAYWRVMGETPESLMSEALSDAQLAGMPQQMIDDMDVVMITPAKINKGRVEAWKGWAVICPDVSQELLSYILTEAEWLTAFSRSREDSQDSQS